MYKNKTAQGTNNISGKNIRYLRKQKFPGISQRAFADRLQLLGLDLDKNAIQRIECGKRFITDIELKVFSQVLHVTADDLLNKDYPETE